jgi:hypothetical protein
VHVVGLNGSAYHFDGLRWTSTTRRLTEESLSAVWGRSPTEIYAVGDQVGLRFDGTRWAIDRDLPAAYWRGLWGTDAEVWAVGLSGRIARKRTDGRWGTVTATGSSVDLYGVWSSGENDVFMVGANGTVLHFDGTATETISSPTTVTLRAVWGSGSDDVYVAGDGGALLHYNGQDLADAGAEQTLALNALYGASSSEIYAAGGSGLLLRFDGSHWNKIETSTPQNLYAAWLDANTHEVWITGGGGTVLRLEGNTVYPEIPGTDAALVGLWGTGAGGLVAVGGAGAILRRGEDR